MGLVFDLIRRAARRKVYGRQDQIVRVEAYQISYDFATKANVPEDFRVLDNEASIRPDWYEYWPIRNFWKNFDGDENCVYGFLSPLFSQKTGIDPALIFNHIELSEPADVYLFTCFPCHGAMFLNVFEQGDYFHSGLLEGAQSFFRQARGDADLSRFVNTSESVVFGNYFFARPSFWRRWLELGNELFKAAESGGLSDMLNRQMWYEKSDGSRKDVRLKVFLMERIASYLLHEHPDIRVNAYPMSSISFSRETAHVTNEIYELDRLKREYVVSLDPNLLKRYRDLQERVVGVRFGGG